MTDEKPAKPASKRAYGFPPELRGKDPKDYTAEDEPALDRVAEGIAAEIAGTKVGRLTAVTNSGKRPGNEAAWRMIWQTHPALHMHPTTYGECSVAPPSGWSSYPTVV